MWVEIYYWVTVTALAIGFAGFVSQRGKGK